MVLFPVDNFLLGVAIALTVSEVCCVLILVVQGSEGRLSSCTLACSPSTRRGATLYLCISLTVAAAVVVEPPFLLLCVCGNDARSFPGVHLYPVYLMCENCVKRALLYVLH